MMRLLGGIVLAVGLLVLLGGIAAPATDTHRSVTCVDSTYGAADGCVESTVQTPNFGKPAMIMVGLTATVVGGGIVAVGGKSEPTADTTDRQRGEGTLAAQIRERNDEATDRSED